jgi:RNA polymerase sigma-70 factor (ECF subfamily)
MRVRSMKHEDVVLVERICQRDRRAFEVLYDRYVDVVFSLTTRMLGRETAEEVTQETFVALWQKAKQFDPTRGSFPSWLLRMARHRAIDELRRQRHKREATSVTEEIDLVIERIPDDAPGVDQHLQSAVRNTVITRTLAELPPEQRAVIVLAYFEGFTQSEIATRLKIPLGTVKKRIRLGLQKLKDAFAREGILKL